MIQRLEPPSTSKSVRKWMASGSVTSRFLFSTSFFSLPHLERWTDTIGICGDKRVRQARMGSLLACRVPLGWAPGCCLQPWILWGWTVCQRRVEPRQSPVCWSWRTASSISTAYRLQTRRRQEVDWINKHKNNSPLFLSLQKMHCYRQWGELVAAQVQRLQLGPLVDAKGQFWDLVTAQVEPLQAAQWVEALRHPGQIITRQVHICQRKKIIKKIKRYAILCGKTKKVLIASPAKCVSPSRLVGMLLWVLWVFLRWRVCRATMAGSWLLRDTRTDSSSRGITFLLIIRFIKNFTFKQLKLCNNV